MLKKDDRVRLAFAMTYLATDIFLPALLLHYTRERNSPMLQAGTK